MKKTATLIKELGHSPTGALQKLYKLDPPLKDWDEERADDPGKAHTYVVVSAIFAPFGPETYIFGSDENGLVEKYLELEGSFRGALDHNKALENAGYKVIENAPILSDL